MDREVVKKWCRLHEFLSVPSTDTAEETERLTAEGIDVQGTIVRVKEMVRKASQAAAGRRRVSGYSCIQRKKGDVLE